jgi:DNA-binding NarL/FixJ family response regulator
MRDVGSGFMNSSAPLACFKGATVPGEKGARIKILFADVHNMVSQGLRRLLEQEADLEVVGEADNSADAVRLARELKPDMIVIEAHLPGMDPANAVRQVKRFERPQYVLVLTTTGGEDRALELLLAGADGCILKTASCEDLVQAIRVIAAGQFICDPALERKILKRTGQTGTAATGGSEQLTHREFELLKLAAQGLNNGEIADRLYLTEGTVKGYFGHIFSKMEVSSRTQAVLEGLKRGWVTLDNE